MGDSKDKSQCYLKVGTDLSGVVRGPQQGPVEQGLQEGYHEAARLPHIADTVETISGGKRIFLHPTSIFSFIIYSLSLLSMPLSSHHIHSITALYSVLLWIFCPFQSVALSGHQCQCRGLKMYNKLKVYLGLRLYIYRPSLVLLSPGLAVYTFTPEQSDKQIITCNHIGNGVLINMVIMSCNDVLIFNHLYSHLFHF